MDFEWDETKYKSNFAKHGISFVQVADMLQSGDVCKVASICEEEKRIIATGLLEGRYVTVIYTMRGEVCRIISARISRKKERRDYEQGKNRPL